MGLTMGGPKGLFALFLMPLVAASPIRTFRLQLTFVGPQCSEG